MIPTSAGPDRKPAVDYDGKTSHVVIVTPHTGENVFGVDEGSEARVVRDELPASDPYRKVSIRVSEGTMEGRTGSVSRYELRPAK